MSVTSESSNCVQFIIKLKLKCRLKKPAHDDISEEKEACIQLFLKDVSVAFLKYFSI